MTSSPQPPRAPKGAAAPAGPPKRRMRGFEAAATLVASEVRKNAEARGFAIARLLTDWPEIVGPESAAHTRPVKISHGKGFGATLTVLTDGAHAPLVQMQLPRLRDRVNAVYGFNAIARIVVTQTAAHGFAEGQAQFRPAPPAAPPAPPPDAIAAADAVAARFDDPRLAESMRRLALARAAHEAQKKAMFSHDRKANK